MAAKSDKRPFEARWDAWKLVCWRSIAGLTQQGLADAVGLSRSAVSVWERGECVPPKKMQAKVAAALAEAASMDVGVDELRSYKRVREFNAERLAKWRADGCPPLEAWLEGQECKSSTLPPEPSSLELPC